MSKPSDPSVSVFYANTVVRTFDEFSYFTGLRSIVAGLFRGCSNLRISSLPDSLLKIGAGAFGHTRGGDPEDDTLGLTALLPQGLTHIGRDAFTGSHCPCRLPLRRARPPRR